MQRLVLRASNIKHKEKEVLEPLENYEIRPWSEVYNADNES